MRFQMTGHQRQHELRCPVRRTLSRARGTTSTAPEPGRSHLGHCVCCWQLVKKANRSVFRGEGKILRISPNEEDLVFDVSRYEGYGVGVRTERQAVIIRAVGNSRWSIIGHM